MSYPHETWWKWLPHEVIIFTKFHEDRTKIMDFLLMANFWKCPVSFAPDFINIAMRPAQFCSPQCVKQTLSLHGLSTASLPVLSTSLLRVAWCTGVWSPSANIWSLVRSNLRFLVAFLSLVAKVIKYHSSESKQCLLEKSQIYI